MSGKFKKLLALLLALSLSLAALPAMAEEAADGEAAPAETTETAATAESEAASEPEANEEPEATAETEAIEEPEAEKAEPLPEGYELAAENDRFTLYFRPDTLAIILESRENGARLYSTVQHPEEFKDQAAWQGYYQSGIVMEFIEDVKSTPIQADLLTLENEVEIEKLENGFAATVRFPAYGVGYQATVTLEERGITVKVPQDQIVNGEADGHRYTVSSFVLYPFLGHSVLGQDAGYMIIPDGQGALIPLQDNEGRFSSPFDRPVYGANIGMEDTVNSRWNVPTEQLIMPVFGMVHTEEQIGFLGVIEEGDSAARIRAYPNGANNLSFDWVSAKYTYRMVYKQPTGPSSGAVDMLTESARTFDIVQHFLIADGEEATYAGLACAWRDYLEEKGFFANAEADRPFDVEIDFLGLEKKNDVTGKADVPMTTFEQAGEILDLLGTDGVKRASVVYRGWNGQGLTGGVPTDGLSPASALGGSDGLRSLVSKAGRLDMDFALEADFLSLNTATHPTLVYSALKKITSQTWSAPTFGPVYETLNYLNPERSAEIADSTFKAFRTGGIPGVALTGITQTVSDYYNNNHYQPAQKMTALYEQISQNAAAELRTTLEASNAYLWKYAHALSDLPVTGSDYAYVSQDVPLLAIALSGKMPAYLEYVNFQANSRKFFLRLVEQGTRPCFLISMEDPIELQHTNSADIYSSRWDLYRVTVARWYAELAELHEILDGASIVAHETEGDVTRVTWSNGVRVYLNYGEAEASLDGVSLDAMSWKAVRADG